MEVRTRNTLEFRISSPRVRFPSLGASFCVSRGAERTFRGPFLPSRGRLLTSRGLLLTSRGRSRTLAVKNGHWRSETDLWRSRSVPRRSETDIWRSLSVPLETQKEAPQSGKRTLGDEIWSSHRQFRAYRRSVSGLHGSEFEPPYSQILGRRKYLTFATEKNKGLTDRKWKTSNKNTYYEYYFLLPTFSCPERSENIPREAAGGR
jgi:hypothetical protein